MKCNNFKYFKLVLVLKNLAMFCTPLNFFGSLCKNNKYDIVGFIKYSK